MKRSIRSGALVGSLLTSSLAQGAAAEDWYGQGEGSSSSAAYNSPQPGEEAVSADGTASAPGKGLGIGMKLGYGLPLGDYVEDAAFEDFTAGAVQPEFALNYGITPSIIVGGYVGLGLGLLPSRVKKLCDMDDDVECSQIFLNIGLAGEYRFLPGNLVNPWLGANVGLEWGFMSVTSPVGDFSSSVFGVGFGPSAGVDFELGRWGLGPFVSYQAGKYMTADMQVRLTDEDGEGDQSGSIDNKAFHGWLSFGARARYTFAN